MAHSSFKDESDPTIHKVIIADLRRYFKVSDAVTNAYFIKPKLNSHVMLSTWISKW